jgi:hypothetical protein
VRRLSSLQRSLAIQLLNWTVTHAIYDDID